METPLLAVRALCHMAAFVFFFDWVGLCVQAPLGPVIRESLAAEVFLKPAAPQAYGI